MSKPARYWDSPLNRKEFLDGLLEKYSLIPAQISHRHIIDNGGRALYKRYGNMLDLIEGHYGPICLLDMPRVPPGTWDIKENRVKSVQEAVKRLGKAPRDIMLEDFCRMGLKGCVGATKQTHIPLLREAGFDVPDPVSWAKQTVRAKAIREIVEEVGGVNRVTRSHLDRHAPGLVEHYAENRKELKVKPHTPLLYTMLSEAGYDVTPQDCERGFGHRVDTCSKHGHICHSLMEALIDDWVYSFVKHEHTHHIFYPGQTVHKTQGLSCDIVIYDNISGSHPMKGLWIEYGGMLEDPNRKRLDRYKKQLTRKKKIAQKYKLKWLVIKPNELIDNPRDVWNRMVTLAPWLKMHEEKALHGKALIVLRGREFNHGRKVLSNNST